MIKNFHEYNFPKADGSNYDFAELKGKVVLIVNTASECGFTPQLKEMEALYQTYKENGLVVLAFPSNQFGKQEPLNGNEIATFCEKNYGASFTIMEKSDVKGENQNEVFQFLSEQSKSKPKWNFHKYLIDKNGEVVDYFLSITKPNSKKVKKHIEKLL